METVARELEQILKPWRLADATELEQQVAARLAHYEKSLAAPHPPPNRSQPWTVVQAAGGIVWRRPRAERSLALIHRPRYDDWCLPKGKLDPGEAISAAARREVREETMCDTAMLSFAGIIHYLVKTGPKFVFYWEMEAIKVHPFKPSKEVDRWKWFSPPAALVRLTYDVEREFLQRVMARRPLAIDN